uniref:Uncharacterized protein n=1 Tax=Anguilla anguilla TaxID=7936 RepID=A0A0E9TXJ4_ANGAN
MFPLRLVERMRGSEVIVFGLKRSDA